MVKSGLRYYSQEHSSPQDYFDGTREMGIGELDEIFKTDCLRALDRLGIERRSKHMILGEFLFLCLSESRLKAF